MLPRDPGVQDKQNALEDQPVRMPLAARVPGPTLDLRAVVSPYDTSARYARHGHTISWKGFSVHLTETLLPTAPT